MILALLLGIASAQVLTPPSFVPPADPRIVSVPYRSDRVVPLRVAAGYAAVVEFAADERIENVVVGDSAGWQVTANRAGDRLIVKPLGAVTTNLVVLTDARRYVFVLETASDPAAGAFALRFDYPPLPDIEPAGTRPAGEYRLRGDKALFPATMSDDGARTRITWGAETPIPAVFALDDKGRETLVNARMVEGDYVVEGVARRYVLRRGKDRATATRRPMAGR